MISFNRLFVAINYFIIFGVTLVFSTATRSVFEVSKLGIIKVGISALLVMALYDKAVHQSKWFSKFRDFPVINGSLIVLLISHVVSTLFSQNILLSVYGSYDRWEGLITYTLYILYATLLINYKSHSHRMMILLGVLTASCISSLYGIIQSFGLDIIQWSLDSSKKVFASINNPVHYCATMGMIVPVILGQLFYAAKKHRLTFQASYTSIGVIILYYLLVAILFNTISITQSTIQIIVSYLVILFIPIGFIFFQLLKRPTPQSIFQLLIISFLLTLYATFISYSRATWLGLTASLGLMFVITSCNQQTMSFRRFMMTCISTVIITAVVYLTDVFYLHTTSVMSGVAWTFLLAVSIAGMTMAIESSLNTRLINAIIQLCMVIAMFSHMPLSVVWLSIAIGLLLVSKSRTQQFLSTQCLAFIMLFATIQFISDPTKLIELILMLVIVIASDASTMKNQWLSSNSILHWKIFSIGIMSLLLLSPTIMRYLYPNHGNKIITEASVKINSYQYVAIDGTARTSMWKSSFPWIRDYLFIGSGLDTIKFMYPVYRRPEYGRLEGGHNYTPDRLHNEYLNTLATKGIFGFAALYFGFIGIGTYAILRRIYALNTAIVYIIIGCLGGSFVYLGQILFNFGVVATLTLFYCLFAIGVGYSIHENN